MHLVNCYPSATSISTKTKRQKKLNKVATPSGANDIALNFEASYMHY